MATFTIKTTAKEDSVISFMLNQANVARAKQIDINTGLPPTPWTALEFINNFLATNLMSWALAAKEDTHHNIKVAFEAASSTVQAQIKTTLGVP